MTRYRVYSMSVASVYPHRIAKAEKKGRTKAEVDKIVLWLTGDTQEGLDAQLRRTANFEDFLADPLRLNPSQRLTTGVICGVRVENTEEPTMQEVRCLDKLTDELAQGKAMEKVLRN